MDAAFVKDLSRLPLALLWARPSRDLGIVEGEYEPESQQWSQVDHMAVTTWSRSSTTGILFDDPDEDKDD